MYWRRLIICAWQPIEGQTLVALPIISNEFVQPLCSLHRLQATARVIYVYIDRD